MQKVRGNMLKAYKFRLYPTKEQIVKLNMHFGHTRFVYNYFLEYSKSQYNDGNKTNYNDWSKALTQLKRTEDYSWLKDVNSQTLQQSLMDLQSAFKNFFSHCGGYPKFKKKNKKNSFRVPQFVQLYEDEGLIFFPKFGEGIKVRIHRKLPQAYKIKQATISKTPTGKFFVSVLIEIDEPAPVKDIDPQKAIGIDMGLKDFAILSDGKRISHPKVLAKYERNVERCQKSLSKKEKGSHNREKARHKLALVHEKITNVRMDFIHKLTRELVSDSQVDLFALEDLNVSGMMKNHKLAKSISDSSWSMFKRMLTYKAESLGKEVIEIDRFFPSSKTCGVCGYKAELTLEIRKWECPNCHTIHDRDINAAINIRNQGIMKHTTAGIAENQACGERVRPANSEAMFYEAGNSVYTTE